MWIKLAILTVIWIAAAIIILAVISSSADKQDRENKALRRGLDIIAESTSDRVASNVAKTILKAMK